MDALASFFFVQIFLALRIKKRKMQILTRNKNAGVKQK